MKRANGERQIIFDFSFIKISFLKTFISQAIKVLAMKNKFTLLLILSLVGIISVSGCIGQSPQGSSSNGLIIKNVYTDPPSDLIKVTDQIVIFFEVENVGAFKAKNVFVEVSGANWAPSESTRVLLGDINPPDPITNSPGGLKPVAMRIPAPIVPEGSTVTYPLKIRVTYNYGSSAAIIIPAYSEQRYQRDIQQGKLTPTTTSELIVQQSKLPTPIKVSVLGPDKMVVPNYPYEEFNYHITFTNIGDGVPITSGQDGLVHGGLWITGPGAYFKNCLGLMTDSFANNPLWTTPTGINTIQNLWQFYYQNTNTRALVRYDDNSWGYAFEYSSGGFALGINSVNAFVRYPTILDWEFLGSYINGIKLRTGTRSVTRPCTIAIDNQGRGGWESRETDTITLNFDLRYTYYIEKDFTISITAPIIKNPNRQ